MPRSLEDEEVLPDFTQEEDALAQELQWRNEAQALYEGEGWTGFESEITAKRNVDWLVLGTHGTTPERTEFLRGRVSMETEMLNLRISNAERIDAIRTRFEQIEALKQGDQDGI